MPTAFKHNDSSVNKDGKFAQNGSQKDTSSPRKAKVPDNRHLYEDTDDPSQSDSSLPEIGNGKHRRLTKTRKTDAIFKTKPEVEELHLPRINSVPSLVGSEKKDDVTEKEKDESESDLIQYTDHPILKKIQDNVIGNDLVINTPYGNRNVVYCDFTASGRTLSFIENFIKKHVCPTYANTHSTTGHNARQTGKYREEARSMIKHCVNANKDDVVIFTGSGATAAMHKLAWALKITQTNVAKDTVVIIGPYEHHSNILPWREYGTKCIRLREEHDTGKVDLQHLHDELKFWKEKRRQVLVCLSAASNVTGIITDTDAVASIAHKYGALVVFDYAAGGPYMTIDMNTNKTAYKDAVILSPHKFVGGPGTPGVIIAKKWIFKNPVPDKVGGGTVRMVTRETHGYVSNIEEREEGGTPAIIESIRAGLVFKLKQDVGEDLIQAREDDLCRRAFGVWEKNPCIYVLGNHVSDRVPIFSFLTMHSETGRLIHHNFISTLLSDLFGIQARGGCACAGPYAEDLLGMTEPLTKKFVSSFLVDRALTHDKNAPPMMMEIMKPGFTRINLSYFYDDAMINFVIAAVDMVTKYGWKLLPQYTFDIRSGSFTHKDFSNKMESELKTLDADIFNDRLSRMSQRIDDNAGPNYDETLAAAEQIFSEAEGAARMARISSASLTLRDMLPRDKRKLRWFLTPSEAMNIMADINETFMDQPLYTLPFKLATTVPRSTPHFDSDYLSVESQSSNRSQGSAGMTNYSSSSGGGKRSGTSDKGHSDRWGQTRAKRNNASVTHQGRFSDNISKHQNESQTKRQNGSLAEHQNGSLAERQNGSLAERQNGSQTERQNASLTERQNGSLTDRQKVSPTHQNGSLTDRQKGSLTDRQNGSLTDRQKVSPNHQNGSLTERQNGSLTDRQNGSLTDRQKVSPTLQNGSLTDRSERSDHVVGRDFKSRNHVFKNGSQTDRSERTDPAQRSRSLQQRDRFERVGNDSHLRDGSVSKSRPERTPLKERHHQANIKRRVVSDRQSDCETCNTDD